MQAALEILEYGPIWHGFSMFMRVKDTLMWQDVQEAKFPGCSRPGRMRAAKPFGREEFDQLLGEFEVASDTPIVAFSQELIEAYPEAKVIIMERNIESWYQSFNRTFIHGFSEPISQVARVLGGQLGTSLDMLFIWVSGSFGARSEKELQEKVGETYKKHYVLIKAITPKDRLFEYRHEHGWEPLWAFLGTDIPDVPFPRINDTAGFKARQHVTIKQALIRVSKRFVQYMAGAVAIVVGWWWYR